MELFFFIGLGWLVFSHLSLRKRVQRLESDAAPQVAKPTMQRIPLADISSSTETTEEPVATPLTPKPPVFTPAPEILTSRPIPLAAAAMEPTAPAEPKDFFLYTWFREQTLIKIGSIIFFLGAVWFVGYAIEQNWIPPLLRIVLGLLLAMAVYTVGHWRRLVETTQYQTLTTLGSGIFLGTVTASQFAFASPILPAPVAFLLMIFSIAYTLFVAVNSKTEWLAIIASVAGLVVPFLIKVEEPQSTLLLVYLLFLTAGFLAVVFITSWRAVALTLLLGTGWHLLVLQSASALTDTTTWFFVVIFSALFCASTTISIFRTNKPTGLDTTLLALLTLQFVTYAIALALLPGLALFIAAAVTAVIGYTLHQRQANVNSVSIYVAISLICSLIGTTILFDGFILTIVFALEALAIFLISLKIATVMRSIYVATALFLLPLAAGLVNLTDPAWEESIFHPAALGTLSVLITLGIAITWILSNQKLQAVNQLRHIAGTLLVGWYGFALITIPVVATAVQSTFDTTLTNTSLFTLLAVGVIWYLVHNVSRPHWHTYALLTLIPPTFSALGLLAHDAWANSIAHQPFAAALFYFCGLIGITIFYWQYTKHNLANRALNLCAHLLVWVILGYGFLFLETIWDALLTGDANRVVTSISFTALTYLLLNCLMLARANISQIGLLTLPLIIPGLLLIESLQFGGWSSGALGIDAIGIYVTITILFLLATTLRQYKTSTAEDTALARNLSTNLYGVGGVLIYCLVWIISQTVFTSAALAVTIALFVYTVVGLATYSYGRTNELPHWRRIGVLLLGTVILRLALVDVRDMEPVWRIVTFLGIGLLFILTALFERSHKPSEPVTEE